MTNIQCAFCDKTYKGIINGNEVEICDSCKERIAYDYQIQSPVDEKEAKKTKLTIGKGEKIIFIVLIIVLILCAIPDWVEMLGGIQ